MANTTIVVIRRTIISIIHIKKSVADITSFHDTSELSRKSCSERNWLTLTLLFSLSCDTSLTSWTSDLVSAFACVRRCLQQQQFLQRRDHLVTLTAHFGTEFESSRWWYRSCIAAIIITITSMDNCMSKYMLNMGTVSVFSGICALTIVRKTAKERNIVTEKDILSPDSAGRTKVTMLKILRKMVGKMVSSTYSKGFLFNVK